MKITGIIPARYASSRFPGKPLADILGKPMIRRVYEQVQKCSLINELVVATDDERILKVVKDFGGQAVMTSPEHATGTERCNEAAMLLNSFPDVIINIQGDEPFIDPGQVEQVACLFMHEDVQIATLRKKISSSEELFNPNVVKVITDKKGRALYFSRNPIPYVRGSDEAEWLRVTDFYRHVGIYGYRTSILREIVALPEAPPEKAESLEQLRWLWNGYSIMAGETFTESISVDSPADLLKITNRAGRKDGD